MASQYEPRRSGLRPNMTEASFIVERQPWVKTAACRDVPTEVFFEPALEPEALAYCQGCAHRGECLALAMKEEGSAPYGRYGVRGGTTPLDRQRLHRGRNRVA